MPHNLRMLTRDQLAAILRDVSVEDTAAAANLSTKTLYRLRHKKNAPNLQTVEKVLAAVASLNPAVLKKHKVKVVA